jgi:hypothetical protein
LNKELMAELEARQTIREQPFRSDVPIIGPLISRFRAMWNSISTRWYVLPLLQQQSEFNALLVFYLRAMEAAADARRDVVDGWMCEMSGRLNEMGGRLSEMSEILNEVDARTIGTDQDQTQLTRNVAELSYQLTRLIRLSDKMNAGLTQPEDRGQMSITGHSSEE